MSHRRRRSFVARSRQRSQTGRYSRRLRIEPLEDRRLLSITVNTLIDENDGIGVGNVSLREAIASALPGETIDFSVTGTIALSNLGELVVNKNLLIDGPGAELLTVRAFDPVPESKSGDGRRVFNFDDGNSSDTSEITISGLTITGGDTGAIGGAIFSREDLTIADCMITGNSAFLGGGLYNASGSLAVTGGAISGNAATIGGGLFNYFGNAVFDGSTISDNSATFGAGIINYYGALTLSGSTISGNSAGEGGGGISSIGDGTVDLTSSTVSGNSANYGAGIQLTQSTLTITDSQISENVAVTRGGGIFQAGTAYSELNISGSTISGNSAGGNGGGVWNHYGSVTVASSTISGNSSSGSGGGLFAYDGGVTISASTISGNSAATFGAGVYSRGQLNVSLSMLENNLAGGNGGAIWFRSGNLDLSECTISGNSSGGSGGGVFSYYGTETVTGSTISGNSAANQGGGIWNRFGSMAVTSSSISSNSSSGSGGGLYNSGSVTTLTLSTISGNSAVGSGGGVDNRGSLYADSITIDNNSAGANGGGVWSQYGVVNLTSSNISGNSAENGAGIYSNSLLNVSSTTISNNIADDRGGGICSTANNVTVVSSTISSNTASIGGGLFTSAAATIRHSTVAANSTSGVAAGIFVNDGFLSLDHAIVAGNFGGSGDINGLLGTEIVPEFSLIGNNQGSGLAAAPVGAPDAEGNLIGTAFASIDPLLSSLSDNGGLTRTHSLLAGSPAINAGDPAAVAGDDVPEFDQRGTPFARVLAGRIDIGAFEAPPGEIRGTIWNDLDGDGEWDQPTEPGLEGWTVFLDSDRDGVLDDGELSAVTDTDGSYLITDVAPGEYLVTEIVPPGWEQTSTVGLPQLLVQLSAHHQDITALVPNRYDFFEGETGTNIIDGGNDMYDFGNYMGTNRGGTLNYTNGVVVSSPAFGPGSQYFTVKHPGLFALAATNISIEAFGIDGDVGADGFGSVDGDVLHTTVDGQPYTIFLKRIYNAFDPSVNHIIMVPGDGTGVSHIFSPNTNADFHAVFGLSSVTEIYYALVAREFGQYLANADVLNIAHEFLNLIEAGGGQLVNVGPGEDVTGVDFGNQLAAEPPALPGDYNGNNFVDAADYAVWRHTLGQTGVMPYSGADGDGDGSIDADDYGVWTSHFGMSLPGNGLGSIESAPSLSGGFDPSSGHTDADYNRSQKLSTLSEVARPVMAAPGAMQFDGLAIQSPAAAAEDALLAWLAESDDDTRATGDVAFDRFECGTDATRGAESDRKLFNGIDTAFRLLGSL